MARLPFSLLVTFLTLFGIGQAEEISPPEVLASVRIGRFGGCSGTIIGADDEQAFGLSCAHCCSGVGNPVGVCFVDGSISTGRWLATDPRYDLSLFAVSVDSIIGSARIPTVAPNQEMPWTAVGFPQTRGPIYKTLRYEGVVGNDQVASKRWQCLVTSGKFDDGDSGGGIFQKSNLIGVISHHGPGPEVRLQGASHNQITDFLWANRTMMAKVRNHRQDCPDGNCPIAPKPDPLTWKPEANVPIVLPKADRQNPTTLTDKAATRRILELEERVSKLEKLIAEIHKPTPISDAPAPPKPEPSAPPAPAKGDKGDRGDAGPPGRDGKDGATGVVTVILKWSDGTPIATKELKSGQKLTQLLRKDTTSDTK